MATEICFFKNLFYPILLAGNQILNSVSKNI